VTRPVLHIAGCGRVGRTLARLWADAGVLEIGQVLNRSPASAERAVRFIGRGRAVERFTGLGGDWLMLALPDGELQSRAEALAASVRPGPALVFHVSGAESSELLKPFGVPFAAIHPVCPFADPARAIEYFAGSFAVGEGDPAALDRVLPVFEAIGARTLAFEPSDKRRYHAATIAASNFLNVIDDLALGLAEAAGLARGQALEIITALQRAGLAGIEARGPEAALTGPIERADDRACRRIANVLASSTPREAALFATLSRAAAELASRKHPERLDALSEIDRIFAGLAADG